MAFKRCTVLYLSIRPCSVQARPGTLPLLCRNTTPIKITWEETICLEFKYVPIQECVATENKENLLWERVVLRGGLKAVFVPSVFICVSWVLLLWKWTQFNWSGRVSSYTLKTSCCLLQDWESWINCSDVVSRCCTVPPTLWCILVFIAYWVGTCQLDFYMKHSLSPGIQKCNWVCFWGECIWYMKIN